MALPGVRTVMAADRPRYGAPATPPPKTMGHCALCFDSRKLAVGEDIVWCTECTPMHVRGMPTTAGEEMPDPPEAPKRKAKPGVYTVTANRNEGITYRMDGGILRGDMNYIVGGARGHAAGVVVEEPVPVAEIQDGYLDVEGNVIDPSWCTSCGDHMQMREVDRTVQLYNTSIERAGDEWLLWASLDTEDANVVEGPYFVCPNCGRVTEFDRDVFRIEYD